MTENRITRRIGNYKLFHDKDNFWHISIAVQGVWLTFSLGEEEPHIEGEIKLSLIYKTKDSTDANP